MPFQCSFQQDMLSNIKKYQNYIKKPLQKPLQNRSKNSLVDIGFALSGTCPRIIFNVAAKC